MENKISSVMAVAVFGIALPVFVNASPVAAARAQGKAAIAQCQKAATGTAKITTSTESDCDWLPSAAVITISHCPASWSVDVIKVRSATIAIRPGSRPLRLSKGFTAAQFLRAVSHLCSASAPPPPPVPVVLYQQSGSGIESGAQFTVPARDRGWNEVWTYDCSAFGGIGVFITTISGYGGAADTTDSGTNQLGASGSGTNHYYDTGTFSIDVSSECSWTEEAVSIP
jgi:hypothetical protein